MLYPEFSFENRSICSKVLQMGIRYLKSIFSGKTCMQYISFNVLFPKYWRRLASEFLRGEGEDRLNRIFSLDKPMNNFEQNSIFYKWESSPGYGYLFTFFQEEKELQQLERSGYHVWLFYGIQNVLTTIQRSDGSAEGSIGEEITGGNDGKKAEGKYSNSDFRPNVSKRGANEEKARRKDSEENYCSITAFLHHYIYFSFQIQITIWHTIYSILLALSRLPCIYSLNKFVCL